MTYRDHNMDLFKELSLTIVRTPDLYRLDGFTIYYHFLVYGSIDSELHTEQ
jgi:hypothetical protein